MPSLTIEQPDLSFEHTLAVLKSGVVSAIHGLIPWGSNYTLLADITFDNITVAAIYKPETGERPLWDFPEGTLCQREVAAFELSEALRWRIVPPTALKDGPHGRGSFQYFILHDPDVTIFSLGPQYTSDLKRIALFDALVNNADRKGGHCLLDTSGRLWAIDHGLTFHQEPKLRSVIWDFAGQPIPETLKSDMERLLAALRDAEQLTALRALLSSKEMDALCDRTQETIRRGTYPAPGPHRHYPWPPI